METLTDNTLSSWSMYGSLLCMDVHIHILCNLFVIYNGLQIGNISYTTDITEQAPIQKKDMIDAFTAYYNAEQAIVEYVGKKYTDGKVYNSTISAIESDDYISFSEIAYLKTEIDNIVKESENLVEELQQLELDNKTYVEPFRSSE